MELWTPTYTVLVGGFNHPSEKYDRQIGSWIPNFRYENQKYLSCHHLAYWPESSSSKGVKIWAPALTTKNRPRTWNFWHPTPHLQCSEDRCNLAQALENPRVFPESNFRRLGLVALTESLRWDSPQNDKVRYNDVQYKTQWSRSHVNIQV